MAKGYNKPKGFQRGAANQGAMVNQLQQMQNRMEEVQNALADELVEATVGGGALKITMNGHQEIKAIVIDPDFLKDAAAEGDAEMVQDMLLSAFNSALEKSKALQEERMSAVTGGLSGMMGGLLG